MDRIKNRQLRDLLYLETLSEAAKQLFRQQRYSDFAREEIGDFDEYRQQSCPCGRKARGHPQRDTGVRFCSRCYWEVVRDRQKTNRACGLCACGRARDQGYKTCLLCRERKKMRMRRYRLRKRDEAWDRARMARWKRTSVTQTDPDWQDRFLDCLDENRGMIAPAARTLGISRQTVYRVMCADPDFAFAVDDACLEAQLRRMAPKLKSRRRAPLAA